MTIFKPLIATAALFGLAGCDITPPDVPVEVVPKSMPFAFEIGEAPFSDGAVSVVTAEPDGDMGTYALVPCRDGGAVCLGRQALPLSAVAGHYVVAGPGRDQSFHLMPGGDGFMTRGAVRYPLAWEHVPDLLAVVESN